MWGVKLGKDSWTGKKDHPIKNISDIAFGTFFLDTELCDVFECTVPYFENLLRLAISTCKRSR